MLKEQMRSATETAEQERSINDHSLQLLRDELAQVKQNFSEVTKRESLVRILYRECRPLRIDSLHPEQKELAQRPRIAYSRREPLSRDSDSRFAFGLANSFAPRQNRSRFARARLLPLIPH